MNKMKSNMRVIFTMVVLFAVIMGLYFFSDWFSKTTGYALGEDEKIKLAQCLQEKGTIFFYDSNCADCVDQQEIFGETAFDFISKVDCSSDDICSGLKKTPAWQINNEFYYGKRDLNELIDISGCDVSS